MTRSSNFPDSQKAAIFVRDRALCCYSGKVLWLLDAGATQHFAADWADHVVPVALGGPSTIENGVCATWGPNKAKGASPIAPPLLFCAGRPTEHFFRKQGAMPAELSASIGRFEALHPSDWYFNRALYRLLLGVRYLHDGVGRRTRDDRYYCKATMAALRDWQCHVRRERVPSLEARGLAPLEPRADQQIMLDLRSMTQPEPVLAAMRKLLRWYSGAEAARVDAARIDVDERVSSTETALPVAVPRATMQVEAGGGARSTVRAAGTTQVLWFHLFGIRVNHAGVRYRVAGTPEALIVHRMQGDPLKGQTCPRLSVDQIGDDLAKACVTALEGLDARTRNALAKVTAAMVAREFSQLPPGFGRNWTAF